MATGSRPLPKSGAQTRSDRAGLAPSPRENSLPGKQVGREMGIQAQAAKTFSSQNLVSNLV